MTGFRPSTPAHPGGRSVAAALATALALTLNLSLAAAGGAGAAEPSVAATSPAPAKVVPRTGREALPANLKPPAGRPITDAELIARRGAAATGAGQVVPNRKSEFSLRAMSTFLSYGDSSTILPKGCVVWCPDALQSRIAQGPAGTVLPWAEFLAANRAWLAVVEITGKQARGEEPLQPAVLESLKARKALVVATLNGLPITVLAPAPAAGAGSEAGSAAPAANPAPAPASPASVPAPAPGTAPARNPSASR